MENLKVQFQSPILRLIYLFLVVYTAAVKMLSGSESAKFSRKPEIMADAAYAILTSDPKTTTGNFFIDEEVLKTAGITDFDQYAWDPAYKDQLLPDGFIDEFIEHMQKRGRPSLRGGVKPNANGQIARIFSAIEANLSEETVKNTRAVFQFVVTGDEAGKWFVDLKNGKGSCGPGEPPSSPDATLTMDSKNFFEMFSGKIKPATAFMMGKMRISGNMQKALKLEKLMSSLKAKL